jgi:hypothetical protein
MAFRTMGFTTPWWQWSNATLRDKSGPGSNQIGDWEEAKRAIRERIV